jgi:hypothetical protein
MPNTTNSPPVSASARAGYARRSSGWGSAIKTTLRHPKADDGARKAFQEKVKAYEQAGKPLVFIDESGFAHDLPRRKGYAPIGRRCFGTQDWHAKGRTNAVGALLGACLLTVGWFACSINSNVFFAWVTQDLLPKLPENAVVVMDNASFAVCADGFQFA